MRNLPRFHFCGKCPKNPCVCVCFGRGLLVCTCGLVKCHSSVLDIRQQTGMCLGSHSEPHSSCTYKRCPKALLFVATHEWRRRVWTCQRQKRKTHSYSVPPQHRVPCPLESRAALCQRDYILPHLVPRGQEALLLCGWLLFWVNGGFSTCNTHTHTFT